MSGEFGRVESLTFQANGDLSEYRYHAARITSAGRIDVASHAAGTFKDVFGLIWSLPTAADRAVAVAVWGEAKARGGGAVDTGDLVTCNGSGRVVAASSGDMVLGIATCAINSDGEFLRVLLQVPGFRLTE